jgi:hypothetical protein
MTMADRLQLLANTARAAGAKPKRPGKQIPHLCSHIADTIEATSVSCAVQTDAATISLWDLLPKARNEAYERGFTAGKEHRRTEGIVEGVSIGNAEGLVTGLEQRDKDELNVGSN